VYVANKIPVQRCREFVGNHQQYSDSELKDIRNRLYRLAEVVVQKYEQLKVFFTRTVTLDAKARIVNNSK
jgi:hypothetical protein